MTTQRKLLTLLSRTALIAALALAAPLAAAPAGAAPAPAAAGSAPRAEARTPAIEVNHFFKTYRKAVQGVGSSTPEAVRKAHLTAQLDARLTEWAEQNHADPVFRAQNIPKNWKVRNVGSSATTATVVVTQIWGGSPDTEVWYTVRLSDLRITNLTDPPLTTPPQG
ncbi:hypothetical protein ACFYVL_20295 [Streptomyces sp. NPDC004111]|uniref:hypothetical protein n=1 Tax=Streptomyces sp. NPDC004111 TaxID=3364690 RepID=UPI00369208E2